MSASTDLWQRRLTEVVEAIEAIDNGGSYQIGSRTFTSANLSELEAMERLYSIRVAIRKIESGVQEYAIGPRRFRKGDLTELNSAERNAKISLARIRHGGIRVRQGVPT